MRACAASSAVHLSRIRTGPRSLSPAPPLPPAMEWFSRAHRCTWAFNPVGSIWSPCVQTNCSVPLSMKGKGLGSPWVHMWAGAWHPASPGFCGPNECAVSICPSIVMIPAGLLSGTSAEGSREVPPRPALSHSPPHAAFPSV